MHLLAHLSVYFSSSFSQVTNMISFTKSMPTRGSGTLTEQWTQQPHISHTSGNEDTGRQAGRQASFCTYHTQHEQHQHEQQQHEQPLHTHQAASCPPPPPNQDSTQPFTLNKTIYFTKLTPHT
mmetsp:Transcript_10000/g.28872  ORF Transcript_10000/g.28872 Transcript_10000/m.28872 type:complete len:123 (-) Transcript_10000:64-432(-)